MGQSFQLLPLRLSFRAAGRVLFPAGRAGNILRGSFGAALRKLACVAECLDPKSCERRAVCPYARIFEPRITGAGPSGFSDRPRPFVLRVHHLDGTAFQPGEAFHLDIHLFELREPWLPLFVDGLTLMLREGVGAGRGRAELTSVALLDAEGRQSGILCGGAGQWTGARVSPLKLSLAAEAAGVSRIVVRFLTATELKAGGAPVERPEFAVLMARVRDRLSALSAFYGHAPLRLDFKTFGARSSAVRLVRSDLRKVSATRRSCSDGQVHPIGGLLGEAEYAGDLAEFIPFLRAAYWTGVGRQTVWGNGVIKTLVIDSSS